MPARPDIDTGNGCLDMNDRTGFGPVISRLRKAKGLSQKDLAARIRREDGAAISPQYLNDIERGRRNAPPDHLVRQFAEVLEIDADYLFSLANRLPEDLRDDIQAGRLSENDISEVMMAFRRRRDTQD